MRRIIEYFKSPLAIISFVCGGIINICFGLKIAIGILAIVFLHVVWSRS